MAPRVAERFILSCWVYDRRCRTECCCKCVCTQNFTYSRIRHSMRNTTRCLRSACRAAHSGGRCPVEPGSVPIKVKQERASLSDTKLADAKQPDTDSLRTKAARAAQQAVVHVTSTLQGVRDQVLRGGPSLGQDVPGNKHDQDK